jgi:hypothetical protein
MAYVSESIQLAQHLVDMPPNELHTDAFVDVAKQTAAELSCHIEVSGCVQYTILVGPYLLLFKSLCLRVNFTWLHVITF